MSEKRKLDSVAPSALAALLQATGWAQVHSAESLSVWRKDEHDILAPLNSGFSDYAQLIHSAVATLSRDIGRSEPQVLQSLMTVGYDVVELKSIVGIDSVGAISLGQASEAVEALRRLSIGAAYATDDTHPPKALVPSRRPAKVEAFVSSARFGALKNGSTAYALFAPISLAPQLTIFDQGAHDGSTQFIPFERKTMRQIPQYIAAALRAVLETSNASSGLQPFADAISLGVTVPLLRALRGFLTVLPSNVPIEIQYSPMLEPNRESDKIALPSQDAKDVLADAIAFLEAREPSEAEQYQGPVISLGRDPGDLQGAVGMIAAINRKPRRVHMYLGEEDYRLAIMAHEQRVNLVVQGSLRPEGQRLWLDNVTDVSVVGEPANDDLLLGE